MLISDWSSDVCSSHLAERWTSLDRTLERMAAEGAGEINLRPDGQADGHLHRQLLGRAAKLEVLGLAEQIESGIWVIDRKSTRLNSSHSCASRMPSSACKKKTKR